MKILIICSSILLFNLNARAIHHGKGEHEHQEGEKVMMVKPDQSEIVWTGGKKFTDSTHTGTIQLKSGRVFFKNNQPVHGDFVVDMTTIKNTDLEDDGYKKKLVRHLNSEDFFAVEKYKVAKFTFDNVKSLGENQYALTGEMKIRGIKKPETIQATIQMNKVGDGFVANADVVIDRTKYGASYKAEGSNGSGVFAKWFKGGFKTAKDKIIKNNINLSIKIAIGK